MSDPVVQLETGETALFGYGSLVSLPSLERTLGRKYSGPYVTCALRGWRRTWDITMPNRTFYAETPDGRMYPRSILYLNVRREAGTLLNGVLFVVDAAALASFDERESIYDRVDITGELERVRVEGGRACVYVGRSEYRLENTRSPEDAAVRRTYLRILEAGFAAHGETFRTEYEASSDAVPEGLIIEDRVQERAV